MVFEIPKEEASFIRYYFLSETSSVSKKLIILWHFIHSFTGGKRIIEIRSPSTKRKYLKFCQFFMTKWKSASGAQTGN